MSEPRTINLPGSGTDTQQYELAPGLLQYVESVYVEIDNSGGGDARPTLTLAEQSGVVIAKKRQGEAIGGGNSGSATWALRLTDELNLTMSPNVRFELIFSHSSAPMSRAAATFMGWNGPRPQGEKDVTLTLAAIAQINDTLQLAYSVQSTGTVFITLLYADVTNFTTGQAEQLSSNTVFVPSGTLDFVSWDNHDGGAALLDRTFPQTPKFAVAGNYVVNVTLSVDQA